MKFLLVPLLIIGMFATFTAGMLGMLFITGRIQSVEELQALIQGRGEDEPLAAAYSDRDDALEKLFETAQSYKTQYDSALARVDLLQDSLSREATRLSAQEEDLLQRERQLEAISDSALQARRAAKIKELAKFYSKMKAASAAEILQKETELSDTTVAMLMKSLPPGQMGKIMGSMNAEFAARITKLMQQL